MAWYVRLSLAVFGIFLAIYGRAQLVSGHFAYLSHTYRQTVFAPGGIGTGCFCILLACLPYGDWVHRRISTRGKSKTSRSKQPHP